MHTIKDTLSMNNVVTKVTNNDNVTYNKQDLIADKLVKQLGNESYRAFYCKVAYKLSEAEIWNALELAQTGNSPTRYFTWLVKRTGKV